MEAENRREKISRMHHYVQKLCGMYSRIARRMGVDRSFVSRVAKGERRSPEVESELLAEFDQAERNL